MHTAAFDPARFLEAQAPLYLQVLDELKAGRKASHWMWFVFPQLTALGRSSTARFYGLEGTGQARQYVQHSVLGPRLLECSQLVLGIHGRSANQIFGSPDDLKLCSCMTLFDAALPEQPLFDAVLAQLYAGSRDVLTLAHLKPCP